MDWTTIIVTTVTTVGTVLVAWLALRKEMAKLGETATEAKHKAEEAAVASYKTEQSINNRDSPASDRWDAIHDEVKGVADILADQGRDIRGLQETARQTRQSIGQLRGDDRLGRRETELLRRDFSEHLEQAAERDRLIRDLHKQYVKPSDDTE